MAEIKNGDLQWKADLDTTKIDQKLAKLNASIAKAIKDGGRLATSDKEVAAANKLAQATETNRLKNEKLTASIDKIRAATEKDLANRTKIEESTKRQIALNEKLNKTPRKTDVSNSQAEIDTYNSRTNGDPQYNTKGGPSAQANAYANLAKQAQQAANSVGTVTAQTNATTTASQKQKTVLDLISGAYKNVVRDGLSSFGQLDSVGRGLLNSLVGYQSELEKVKGAQRDLAQLTKTGQITDREAAEAKAALVGQERELRQEISKAGAELKRYTQAQQQDLSSIAAKTVRLSELKRQYDDLTDSERKNVNVGGAIRSEFQKLQGETDKLNRALSGTASGGISKLFSLATRIGAGLGIYFGATELISFGKELFDIAKKAQGVEIAFARVGDAADLQKLREATKGTVSDLNLMQQAVKASNFKIPLDVLAKGLRFAQQQARATGQDVDYLTQSFVDGVGRRSPLILDNLGISLTELRGELSKTGDFSKAVGNVIEKSFNQAGTAVDSFADRADRVNAFFENAKKKAADFLGSLLAADTATGEGVALATSNGIKRYGDLTKLSNDELKKAIDKQQKIYADADRKNKLVQQRQSKIKGPFTEDAKEKSEADAARKGEETVLTLLKNQVTAREQAARIQKGQVSLTELQAQEQKLTQDIESKIIFTAQDSKDRDKLIADRKKLREQIAKADGTEGAKLDADETKRQIAEEKRRANEIKKERERLRKEIAKNEDLSYRRTLSRNDEEIAAIRDKYAILREEAKKAGLGGTDLNRINGSERREIGGKQFDQGTEALKESLDKQRLLYAEFEQYRSDFGNAKAKERYGKELNTAIRFTDLLQIELAKLNAIDPANLNSGLTERKKALQDMLQSEMIAQQKFDDARLKQIIENTQTAKLKEREINEKYDRDLALLRERFTGEELADREAKLADSHRQQLGDVKVQAFQETQFYKNATLDITNFNKAQLRERLNDLKQQLRNADLTPEQRRLSRQAISNTESAIDSDMSETEQTARDVAKYSAEAANSFGQLANSLQDINPDLADSLDTLSQMAGVTSQLAGAFAGFAKGGVAGIVEGVTGVISAVASVFSLGAKARASEKKAREEQDAFGLKQYTAQFEINKLYRDRQLEQAKLNQLTLDGLAKTSNALKINAKSAVDNYKKVFEDIQREQFITGQRTEKYGGLFGIGRKTRVVDELGSLAGKSFEQLQELFISGRLTDKAKELFQTLQNLKQEGADIDKLLSENDAATFEAFTGTTAESIRQSIVQGFGEGKRTVQDFADFTEDIVRGAMLSALEYQALEAPIKELYAQFAQDAQSGGVLDQSEVQKFKDGINKTLADAAAFAELLTESTGISLTKAGAQQQQTGLAGAIKSITADQADLLAGQFGGLRLAQLENNRIASTHLQVSTAIEINTRITADAATRYFPYFEQMYNKVNSIANAGRGLGT